MLTIGAIKLRDGLCWTGVVGDRLRMFDIVMYTEFGTTYNSYIMKTGDKVALFETVKAGSFGGYLEKLEEAIDVMRIDYLVTSHTEPNHVESVERLLDCSPQTKTLATPCAISLLKEAANRDFASIAVKDDQQVTTGKRTLHSMLVSNLHRPDTMYTFIEEEQILTTCDSFGSHYCLKEVASDKTQNEGNYLKALCYYFDCIIRPRKPFTLKALDRVESLDTNMMCTGHSPMLVGDRIEQVMALYRGWSTVVNPNRKKTVIIPYISAYGYAGMLAEKIIQGIADSGDTNTRSYDMVMADTAKVREELQFADGMLSGTPTIITEMLHPIWDLMLGMSNVTHGGKYAGAFGSYGWSGESVPHITERLEQLKMKMVDRFKVRFKPSDADSMGVYESGYQSGCLVQSKRPRTAVAKDGGRLVRYLVCGEVFDSSIEICPVCGVGRENFMPVEGATNDFTSNTANDYLILGNGTAGFNATEAVRKRDAIGRITMVSEKPYLPYDRPMLTKPLIAGLEPEQTAMVDVPWYEKNQVRQTLGKRVENVDTDARQALLDDRTKLCSMKLICALGSECFIPPTERSGLSEMAAIRRLSNVKRVEALMKSTERAAVIGSGVLGLEVAWEFKKASLRMTVLKMAPSPMERQMDEGSGKQPEIIASKAGVVIRTGVNVKATERDGHVSSVRLKTGKAVAAGMVIVSVSIRADVKLVEKMGLGTKKGVVVNECMETSVSGVYVCGDCAQYHDGNYGIWLGAVEWGKTVGANAAEDSLECTLVPATLTFHGMDTAPFAAGDNGRNPSLYHEAVGFRDMGKEQYRKYCFLNNRMSGVILMGDLSRMAAMTGAMENHVTHQEVMGNQASVCWT